MPPTPRLHVRVAKLGRIQQLKLQAYRLRVLGLSAMGHPAHLFRCSECQGAFRRGQYAHCPSLYPLSLVEWL